MAMKVKLFIVQIFLLIFCWFPPIIAQANASVAMQISANSLEGFAVVFDKDTSSDPYYRFALLNLTSKTTETMFNYKTSSGILNLRYPYVDPSGDFFYAVEGGIATRIVRISLRRPFQRDVQPVAGILSNTNMQDGDFDNARFYNLKQLGGPLDGSFLIASDDYRRRLRKLDFKARNVTTVYTYTGPNYQGFQDMKVNAQGTRVYLAAEFKVTYVNLVDHSVVNVAGTAVSGNANGDSSSASFLYIWSLAVTANDRYVYVAHYNPTGGSQIRKIDMWNLQSSNAVTNLIAQVIDPPNVYSLDVAGGYLEMSASLELSKAENAIYISYGPMNSIKQVLIDPVTGNGVQGITFGGSDAGPGVADDLVADNVMVERFTSLQHMSIWRCAKPGYDCNASADYARACDVGYVSLRGEACAVCGVGKFANTTASPCVACSSGTYSRGSVTACTVCPTGKVAKGDQGPCLTNKTKQAFALVVQPMPVLADGARVVRLNLSDHTTQTVTIVPVKSRSIPLTHVCVDPSGEGAWLANWYEIYWMDLTPPYNATRMVGLYFDGVNGQADGTFQTARFSAISKMKISARGKFLVVLDQSRIAKIDLVKRNVTTVAVIADTISHLSVSHSGLVGIFYSSFMLQQIFFSNSSVVNSGIMFDQPVHSTAIAPDDNTVYVLTRYPDYSNLNGLYRVLLDKRQKIQLLSGVQFSPWGDVVMGLRSDRLWVASSLNRKIYEILVSGDTASYGYVYGNGSLGASDDLVPDQGETATFNNEDMYISVWSCVNPEYECGYDDLYSEPCEERYISDGVGKCRPCSLFRIIRCKFVCGPGFLRVNNLCLQMLGGLRTFLFSVRVLNPPPISEEFLVKYEQAVAMAFGIGADQVISTLDKPIFNVSGIGRRLLQTSGDSIDIYFVIQVKPFEFADALYAEVAASSFSANLAIAAGLQGLPAGSVVLSSLVGLNFVGKLPVAPGPPTGPVLRGAAVKRRGAAAGLCFALLSLLFLLMTLCHA